MHGKQEILEKLTGIQSSRQSYYKELNYVVDEMKRKNKQLEVINQLTKLQVSSNWLDVSVSIATQLAHLFAFSQFILTVAEENGLSSYIAHLSGREWTCRGVNRAIRREQMLSVSELNQLLTADFPDSAFTTVLLRNHRNQTFGFLTLVDCVAAEDDQQQLFAQIAEHVGVAVENILLFKDVSKKVKIEAQLVQSAKMAAIGEMAAGVAHELNSPLTAILGNIQLLLRESKLDDYQQLMRDIYQCGSRCKKIIQNLLIYSRQEEYQFERLHINDVVEAALGLIGYQLTVSGVHLETVLAEEPLIFGGSRHQIEQIIINLLLNARDAMQELAERRVTIETSRRDEPEGPYIALSVTDYGTGIETEHLDQIFQPFFTTKEATKGTGLGLSVSLGIAESHGGKLLVESEAGSYSMFTLLLPILAEEEGIG